MATRGSPSVFAAFNRLQVIGGDSDGSDEERQQERKEAKKAKKKSRTKKKHTDTAQLKDLAFVAASKPKKSKNKKNKTQTAHVEEAPVVESVADEQVEVTEPKRALADVIKDAQKAAEAAALNGVKAQQKQQQRKQQEPQQKQKQTASPPKQQHQAPKPPQQQQQERKTTPVVPVPAPAAPSEAPSAAPPTPSAPQSTSKAELGAVYSPTHITITRVDGQLTRTVAVTEVMDQLLRYGQQNSQLLMVQEQLGHANRNLQDQLQRSAEIINGLQNEVTMFRQMCLNLQAEVRSSALAAELLSLLRSAPADNTSQQQHRPPPPGMA